MQPEPAPLREKTSSVMSGFPPEDLSKCHLFASSQDGGQELPKGQVLASRGTLLPRQTAAAGACHKAKISRNDGITTQKFHLTAKQGGQWWEGQCDRAEPEPLHQGAQETPESIPKQARGRWTSQFTSVGRNFKSTSC